MISYDEKTGKISARCKKCGVIRKGDKTSTGNFRSHYMTTHSLHSETEPPPSKRAKQSTLNFGSTTEQVSFYYRLEE